MNNTDKIKKLETRIEQLEKMLKSVIVQVSQIGDVITEGKNESDYNTLRILGNQYFKAVLRSLANTEMWSYKDTLKKEE